MALQVERKLEEAEQQLQLQQPQQQLTPRPQDWGPAQALAETCNSTAEMVRQLQQQHAAEVAALQRQVQVLVALTQPDPIPKPWQLNLQQETSKYFLTELPEQQQDAGAAGARQAGTTPKPKLFASGLGLAASVPRFLRWDQPVELHEASLQDVEQQVRGVLVLATYWLGAAVLCQSDAADSS